MLLTILDLNLVLLPWLALRTQTMYWNSRKLSLFLHVPNSNTNVWLTDCFKGGLLKKHMNYIILQTVLLKKCFMKKIFYGQTQLLHCKLLTHHFSLPEKSPRFLGQCRYPKVKLFISCLVVHPKIYLCLWLSTLLISSWKFGKVKPV